MVRDGGWRERNRPEAAAARAPCILGLDGEP
jgi:hypothetical protein